jgi:hypothetical protein
LSLSQPRCRLGLGGFTGELKCCREPDISCPDPPNNHPPPAACP